MSDQAAQLPVPVCQHYRRLHLQMPSRIHAAPHGLHWYEPHTHKHTHTTRPALVRTSHPQTNTHHPKMENRGGAAVSAVCHSHTHTHHPKMENRGGAPGGPRCNK